ncbi:Pathoproteinsis-related thaumatin superfamily protein [Hibiscus syriacus]|uniref:Pathoproteinsis-related thaumatin superfamily protein n=1 Tax=Hibiscus syriacus TaxID=106335 RepID=A0A6A2YM22_HIBSY|nr:Pathoproteinsis-related thaumatin superfamily protein [Hibiscus syriacus]
MARLIRSLRQWPPLQLQQKYHCCSRILTVSTKPPSHCFSFAISTSFLGNARQRPRGIISSNAASPYNVQEREIGDETESDVNKSRNQKKREARRAVRWGMDLASFSTRQIKRVLRVASLEQDVFDALLLVKRLGPDVREGKRRQFNYIGKLLREADPELMEALIQATKVGDQKTLVALAGSKTQIVEEEEEDDEDPFEYTAILRYAALAAKADTYKEVGELRKVVRRVQTSQEQSRNPTEEDMAKIEAAVKSAEKSLTRFLRTLAKQLPTKESFD